MRARAGDERACERRAGSGVALRPPLRFRLGSSLIRVRNRVPIKAGGEFALVEFLIGTLGEGVLIECVQASHFKDWISP